MVLTRIMIGVFSRPASVMTGLLTKGRVNWRSFPVGKALLSWMCMHVPTHRMRPKRFAFESLHYCSEISFELVGISMSIPTGSMSDPPRRLTARSVRRTSANNCCSVGMINLPKNLTGPSYLR
jgi:hypothetical protein